MLRKFLEKVSTDTAYEVTTTENETIVVRKVDGKIIAKEMKSQGEEKNVIIKMELGEEELNKFGMLL